MTCLICKLGVPEPGRQTSSFTRGSLTVVVRDVPGLVCPECGEAYYDTATTTRLLEIVSAAVSGVGRTSSGVAVLEYAAA